MATRARAPYGSDAAIMGTFGEVASFIREPFVDREAHHGAEEPVDTGDLRQAIGELVACSRCVGAASPPG